MKNFSEALEHRKQHNLLRKLQLVHEGIDFYSNDYLGLAKTEVTLTSQLGSTGSRLLSGNSADIESLEKEIAEFHSVESALLFPSGYTANLGLLSAIADRHDTFILDEHVHASIIDGSRLSMAKTYKFRHNDLEDLKKKLAQASGNVFVVTEQIFSMDGSSPELDEISEICKQHNADLIIDQAHSIGLNLKENPPSSIRVITYGKAFGAQGAAILCTRNLKDYLLNFSRPFIYSTAPSANFIALIKLSYGLIQNSDKERDNLTNLISYWNTKKPSGMNWIESFSQIQSLLVSGNSEVTKLSDYLRNQGVLCLPIKSPTVTTGKERIRFCIHSFNTTDQIDQLFSTLNSWQDN